MPQPRRSDITPSYRWNPTAKRYIDDAGRFVSGQAVREAIDDTIDNSRAYMTRLTEAMMRGSINLGTWQTKMAEELRMLHLANAAAAKGGWAQQTQKDFGHVGARVRQQLTHLRDFAVAIENGDSNLVTEAGKLRPEVKRRAKMYADSGRTTYHEVQRRVMAQTEFTHERNVLSPGAKHCDGCLAETAKGSVPIGELTPIGQRDCLGNDRCQIEFRNPRTGETRIG